MQSAIDAQASSSFAKGRIAEARWRSMQYLGDECKRGDGAGADPGRQQQIGKVAWTAFGRCREYSVQTAQVDIGGANFVMRRHLQMRGCR